MTNKTFIYYIPELNILIEEEDYGGVVVLSLDQYWNEYTWILLGEL